MEKRVLHVVKWYPHPMDPQNGIFIQKQIESVGKDPHVLGFINANFSRQVEGNTTLYGNQHISLRKKIRIFSAKVEELKPSIIHFHCYSKDLWALLRLALKQDIRCVHTEHWSGLLSINHSNINYFNRWFIKDYFKKMHLILPVSNVLETGIKELIPTAKTRVVPNIVGDVDFSNPEHITALRFCVVGDIVFSVKRQDLILKAFFDLTSLSCELHFFGGGPDLEALKALCKKAKNVFVHGRVTNKEVLQLLPNYHAHIQFSAFETFGIATLEARKAGIWAISRASFGCSDYADKGVLMAESVEELTKKLSEVIALSKPDVNKFEALSKAEIGRKIQLCYNKLN